MTEKSYFWTHGAGGDAAYSPYNAEEFNMFHFLPVLGNSLDTAYIIPGFLNDLDVFSAGTGQLGVVVKSGAALFDNILYINDADKTIPIRRPTTLYYRWDTVVLRFDQTTTKPKVYLDVLEGVEATIYPVIPTVTTTPGIYEVRLADIFVNYSIPYLTYGYINDKRRFIRTAHSQLMYGGKVGNLLKNSEFLGYSYAGTVGKAPDQWLANGQLVGTFASGALYGSGRGNRVVSVDDGSNPSSIAQYVAAGASKTYTLSFYVLQTGVAGPLYTFSGTIAGYRRDGTLSSMIKAFNNHGNYTSGPEQLTITFPEDDIEKVNVSFFGSGGSGQIVQPILVEGYHPGQCRPVHETIMFTYNTPDAAWNATAKSSGTTTINLAASFGSVILNHTEAVILRVRGRDSGSAGAANCYIRVQGYAAPFNGIYGSLEIAGVTNDNWREMQIIVPTNQIYWGTGVAGAQFRIIILATGAATFDATVQLAGIII